MDQTQVWAVITGLGATIGAMGKAIDSLYKKQVASLEATIAKRDARIAALEDEARAAVAAKDREIEAWRSKALQATGKEPPA